MGRHTIDKVLELTNEGYNLQEISEILECPLHKVRKHYMQLKKGK